MSYICNMINNVRRTVLSILNKSNYGYITPDDFNLFARQAQLEVFENYFYQYNNANNRVNARAAGSDYADIKQKYEENIDFFHQSSSLIEIDSSGMYNVPSITTTGDESYMILGIDIMNTDIVPPAVRGEAEKISMSKIRALNSSNLTGPTYDSAVYTQAQGAITTYPAATGVDSVLARYVRYPAAPRWTYLTFGDGEPLFNQSAADYQDFEVSPSEEADLINKILQMAGMSIREITAIQNADSEETERKAEQG